MDAITRIERALNASVGFAAGTGSPPLLAEAMRYAVFPRGARIRPRLCLAVAGACGDDQPGLTDAAAAAIELLHCASLVHDDLPCFDDAATRRGKPIGFSTSTSRSGAKMRVASGGLSHSRRQKAPHT